MLHALLRVWPLSRSTLAAKLAGVNGFTGRGVIGYAVNRNGAKTLMVRLDGVAGREAEIVAHDAQPMCVKIDNGHADKKFASKQGHQVPALSEGDRVDVVQNGDVILNGVLTRN
jgi:hypothetical protein